MKQLSLENFGVQELDAKEMSKTDGGAFWLGIIAGVLIAEMLDRNAPNDFWEGYNAARGNN